MSILTKLDELLEVVCFKSYLRLNKNENQLVFYRIGLHHTFENCDASNEINTQYIMDYDLSYGGGFNNFTWCPCNKIMSRYFLQ